MSSRTITTRQRVVCGGFAFALAFGLSVSPIATPSAQAAPTSTQAEAQAALTSLNAMKAKLVEAEADYGAALVEQDEARKKMEEAQGRIDEANERISTLQDHLGTRARGMYMSGSTSFLDMLLGASTFQAFTTNWDLLNSLNQSDADMVSETKELRHEVQQKKEEYAEQEKVASAKADEMERIVEETKTLAAQQEAVYNSLSAEAAAIVQREEASANANQQQTQQGGGNNGNSGGSSGWVRPDPPYHAATGNAIVDKAYNLIGCEYVEAGKGPTQFDCSGFVAYVRGHAYMTSRQLWALPAVSNPQPGDVCVIPGHCGIYVGNNKMVHAATYGVGVVESYVQAGMKYVRP